MGNDRESTGPPIALIGNSHVLDPVRRREVHGLPTVEAITKPAVESLREGDHKFSGVLAEAMDGHF